MIVIIRKAFRDLKGNPLLNSVTVLTIALAVLIFSAFVLFLFNAEALLRQWVQDIRVMVYLAEELPAAKRDDIGRKISGYPDVRFVNFISKEDALKRFRAQLDRQASLLDGLKDNPLPASFEAGVEISPRAWRNIEIMVSQIEQMEGITSIEYGQEWLGNFIHILNLFRLTGYGMGGLFFLAAVFFVANTTRLVLYSRRDEIHILRLVGASEGYVRDPFYIQSLMLGSLGGAVGMGVLFILFRLLSMKAAEWHSEAVFFHVQFLPKSMITGIFMGSVLVGWLGCFLSLRHFLKS